MFTAEERETIVDVVATDPHCGVLIPGGAGIRKFRVGFGDRGKRGGARVIYLFGGGEVPIFLLAAFAKNERSDLTAAERTNLVKAAAVMLANCRRRK